MKIDDLSKQELLSLIYHHLPNTIYIDHPCYCAVCSKGYKESKAGPRTTPRGSIIEPLTIICDECEEL